MKFSQLTILLSILLNSTSLFSGNEELVFSTELKEISLDGDLPEWERVKAIPIAHYMTQEEMGKLDCSASFRAGHHKNEIYFAIELSDNSIVHDSTEVWHEQDAVVIYLNFCSIGAPAGVARIILNQNDIEVQNHGVENDPCNSFLSAELIKHKFKKRNDILIYEVAIVLAQNLLPFQTIGVDFQILDIDKDDDKVNEFFWCDGDQHRYYMPGNLGDLVFTGEPGLSTARVSGQVMWEHEQSISIPLPTSILVQSKKYKDFILESHLDSLGRFNIPLPEGEYEICSGDKNTSQYDMGGYDNQKRINIFDRIDFFVGKEEIIIVDTLKLRTYAPPDYLFQSSGVMHDYKKVDEAVINAFIENYRAYYNIPAVSLALIKDDEVVFTHSYGTRNAIHGAPCQSNSVFQIASVSKSIFAFIVMRLVEKGILDLDTPLYGYLPFENIAHNQGYESITARLVLSHQTGLPNWAWGGPGGWESGRQTDLSFLPGTKFQYSGEGYEYLGRVIEHLTSRSLNELLEEEFKKPLGIKKLYFTDNDDIEQVRGHIGDNPTFWFPPHIAGVSYSILTDAESFAKFVCELGKQEHLKKETYQEMFKPLQSVTGFEHPDNLYWNQGIGLGLFTQESPFGKAVMHGGNNGDFQGEFVYYTDAKIGFVLFTNSNRGHKLGQELGRFLFYGKS